MMSYYTRGYGSCSNLDWNAEDSISNLSDFADSIAREEADLKEWAEKQERMAIKRAEAAARKAREQEEAKQQEELLQQQKAQEILDAKALEDARLAALDDGSDIPPWHRGHSKHSKPAWLLELLVKVAEKEDADDMYLIYKRPQQLPIRQELPGIKQAALEEAQNEHRIYKTPYALPPKKEAQVVAQATKEEIIEYIEEEIIMDDADDDEHEEEVIDDEDEEILVDDNSVEEEVVEDDNNDDMEEEVVEDDDDESEEEVLEDEMDEDDFMYEEVVEDTVLKRASSSEHTESTLLTTTTDASVMDDDTTPSHQPAWVKRNTQNYSTPEKNKGTPAVVTKIIQPTPAPATGLDPAPISKVTLPSRSKDTPAFEAPWKNRNLKKTLPSDKESNDSGNDDNDTASSYHVPWKNVQLKARIQPKELNDSKVQAKLEQKSPILKPAFTVTKEQLTSSKPHEKMALKPVQQRPSIAAPSPKELESSMVHQKLKNKPMLHRPSFEVSKKDLKNNVVVEKLSHKPSLEPLLKSSTLTPTKHELASSKVQEKLRNKPMLHRPSFEVSKKDLESNIVVEKLSHKPNLEPLLKLSLTPTKDELKSSKVQQKLRSKPILRRPSFEVSKRDLVCNVVKEKLSKKPDISNLHALAKGEEMITMKKKLRHCDIVNVKGPSDMIASAGDTPDSPKAKPQWMQRALEMQRSSRDLVTDKQSTNNDELAETPKARPQWMRDLSLRQSSRRLDDDLNQKEIENMSQSLPREHSSRRFDSQDQEIKDTTSYAVPWKDVKLKPRISVADLQKSQVQEKLGRRPVIRKPSFSVSESELKASVVQQKLRKIPGTTGSATASTTKGLIQREGSLKSITGSQRSNHVASPQVEESPKSKPAWMLRTLELQQSLSNLDLDNEEDNKAEVPWANYKLKSSSKSGR